MSNDLVLSLSSTRLSPADLDFFKKARYIRELGSGPVRKRRAYAHNVLKVGNVVSAVVRPHPDDVTPEGRVQTVTNGSGTCRYYAVTHIVENTLNGDVWIFGKEMRAAARRNMVYSCSGSELVHLRLDGSCRRVAVIHKCGVRCIRKSGWAMPVHNESVLGGGSYRLVSRACGYPPFLG